MAAAVVLMALAPVAYADEVREGLHEQQAAEKFREHYGDDDDNRERIRKGVESGELKSLAELRRIVLAQVSGEIVDTDADDRDDRIIYEFRVLVSSGHIVEIELDAATGKILEIEND